MTLSSKLSITWPEITNERSAPMLWLGAWLLGPNGEEGDWYGEEDYEYQEEQEEENTVAQHTRFRVTLVWQPQKGAAPGGALSAATNP